MQFKPGQSKQNLKPSGVFTWAKVKSSPEIFTVQKLDARISQNVKFKLGYLDGRESEVRNKRLNKSGGQ